MHFWRAGPHPWTEPTNVAAGTDDSVTQTEFIDDCAIALEVCALKIFQQAAPLADFDKQTSTARVIFFVGLQMSGQIVDRLSQERDLHFGRAGVFFTALEAADNR